MNTITSSQKLGTGGPFWQRLGRALLPVTGWQVEGRELLTGHKYVLVVAPHTSNWDLPVGLVCGHALGLFADWRCGFMIKDSATRWPLIGRLLKWFGGIPVNRQAPQNLVDQMLEVFERNERLLVAVTPEGTRERREYWKTGFYRIALKAQVPIALAYLDYKRRTAGIGQIVIPSGDMEADFALFRAFYSGVTARFPEAVGLVQFRAS
jgi:1-acyl-sn-glycerol-3-phosphate acyltransferase